MQRSYEEGGPIKFERYMRIDHVTESHFLDARRLYKFLSKTDDYTLRIEGSTTSVYSNNREWLHTVKSAMQKDNLLEFWEPDPTYIDLLDSNTIIVDHDNGYKFKVTFGPAISDTRGFANWAKNNPTQVRVGAQLMHNLENDGYVCDMYFYAKNEKIINLCSLMLSNIRRIDKLVVKADLDK